MVLSSSSSRVRFGKELGVAETLKLHNLNLELQRYDKLNLDKVIFKNNLVILLKKDTINTYLDRLTQFIPFADLCAKSKLHSERSNDLTFVSRSAFTAIHLTHCHCADT